MAQAARSRVDLSTQACDICRKRKVKCLLPQSGSSRCQRCERLNLACTFVSPSKTRGPKKRATHTPGPEDSSPATYWTDDICDRTLFEIIMQDYLSHVYPLVPVVHRPSFKRSLQDLHQRDECFAAVTVSIAALVVATMPSKFQAYKAHDPPLRFESRKEMVHFCYMKVVNLRVSTYYDQLNFQKFAISYLFFAAFLQLGDHNWSRMLSVEAFQLARLLDLHRISEYRGLNCIEAQLRKKGFWLVFYCYVHATLQNLHGERLSYLDPVTLHSIRPDELMPLEVPDESIFEHEVFMSDDEPICLTTGFILHSRVFWAAIRSPCPIPAQEPCPCIRAHNPQLQVAYFQERLENLRHLLDDIPESLQSWTTDQQRNAASIQSPLNSEAFASMRVNIHVTHLWLQSLIMDQLEAAQAHQQEQGWSSETFDQRNLWQEREEICRRLLFIVYNFPPMSLETNGLHLANKVRDISASLLACPFPVDDPISERVREYVRQSTEILSRLDRSESLNTMHFQTWVDTDRIKEG